MKHIPYSAIIACSLMLIPSCKPEEEEINLDITVENICGHWVEKQVTFDNRTYDSDGSSTYDFRADGTFHYTNLDEAAYDGTWKLEGTVLTKTYEDGTGTINGKYDIDKLTDRTLILSQKGGASTTYKRK
ncbi:MAG: lipocalin family protein [Bacteroidales bacterium]|nr:lipocalin family protein [Candidatus Colicola faecequi]